MQIRWPERAAPSLGNITVLHAPPRLAKKGDVTWVESSLPAGAFATEVLNQAGVALPTAPAEASTSFRYACVPDAIAHT